MPDYREEQIASVVAKSGERAPMIEDVVRLVTQPMIDFLTEGEFHAA